MVVPIILALLCASAAATGGIEATDEPPSAEITAPHPIYNWTVAMRDVHLYHFKTWGFHEGKRFCRDDGATLNDPVLPPPPLCAIGPFELILTIPPSHSPYLHTGGELLMDIHGTLKGVRASSLGGRTMLYVLACDDDDFTRLTRKTQGKIHYCENGEYRDPGLCTAWPLAPAAVPPAVRTTTADYEAAAVGVHAVVTKKELYRMILVNCEVIGSTYTSTSSKKNLRSEDYPAH